MKETMGECEFSEDGQPLAVQWPTEPQEALPLDSNRIWVDGCFDFAHHGHAGAMLQARRLGHELVVGVHSDESILQNKGPPVMTLKERIAAVDACRWVSKSIPHAPYVTSLPWVTHYGCQYVVHGDDITSDSNGDDCYRYVKAAKRFKVVQRTPGISTTDLVGRMLLCTRSHFVRSLLATLDGEEGEGNAADRKLVGQDMQRKIEDYATDESGLSPHCSVFACMAEQNWSVRAPFKDGITSISPGKRPHELQRVVYVDGGFDLFSPGHIEFLRQVTIYEADLARAKGSHNDLSPYIIAGIHDDVVINQRKGLNYPIMNIFERGLCVLQCRYIDCVVFSAPLVPSRGFLSSLPFGTPHAVYHGPTAFMPLGFDPYLDARALGLFRQLDQHDFQEINAEEIVQRILRSRQLYEARQIAKGEKAALEQSS